MSSFPEKIKQLFREASGDVPIACFRALDKLEQEILDCYAEDQKKYEEDFDGLCDVRNRIVKELVKYEKKDEEHKQKLERMLKAEIENYKTATQAHEPVLQAYANGRRKLLRELLG